MYSWPQCMNATLLPLSSEVGVRSALATWVSAECQYSLVYDSMIC